MSQKKVVVIGAGFGGLGTACLLSKAGYDVTVIEKNEQVGGRAGYFEIYKNTDHQWVERSKGLLGDAMQDTGVQRSKSYESVRRKSSATSNEAERTEEVFRFDTGPSWFLMRDVFEHFFELMSERLEDHLELIKLQPSYRVFYKEAGQQIDLFGNLERDCNTLESIELGSGEQLKKYLARSQYIYQVAIKQFLYKNYNSAQDFLTPTMLREGRKLGVFSNLHRYAERYFKSPELQKIMEYPAVFLGTSPYKTPALYSLLSHVIFNQGVFYPRGGMYEVTKALENVARNHGTKIRLNTEVNKIIVENDQAVGVRTSKEELRTDIVISNADPYFTETQLLETGQRDHSKKYWQSRTLAPSALLIYLGVKGKLPTLTHHNLLFSNHWRQNFAEVFGKSYFPTDPSFYVSKPSQTDPTVAPKDHENLFVLVPVAAGVTYTEQGLQAFARTILETMEYEMNLPGFQKNIVYQRLFCVKDFQSRFNSFYGTGLGLAHTLRQSAAFRPSNQSKKIKNLFYVGANTHPGIGLPATLISAELVMRRLQKLD